MHDKDKVPKNIVAAIRRIVRGDMGRFGLRTMSVEAGEDHDGDPVLFVDVYYDRSERPIDTKVVAGLVSKVQAKLRDLGEERFAHLRHHFAEDQKAAGWA